MAFASKWDFLCPRRGSQCSGAVARPGGLVSMAYETCVHGIGSSAVGEQDLAFAQTIQATQHIVRAAPVMGLSRREFEDDGPAIGIY